MLTTIRVGREKAVTQNRNILANVFYRILWKGTQTAVNSEPWVGTWMVRRQVSLCHEKQVIQSSG